MLVAADKYRTNHANEVKLTHNLLNSPFMNLLIVNAGSRNTLSVFIPGADGLKPALQGMVFCLLAFVGFEAAAPLAEEARDPRRTIGKAVIYSCLGIGLFYVLTTYAATVFNSLPAFAK